MIIPVASQSRSRLCCSGDPSTLQFVTKSVNFVARVYRYSQSRFGARSAKQACSRHHEYGATGRPHKPSSVVIHHPAISRTSIILLRLAKHGTLDGQNLSFHAREEHNLDMLHSIPPCNQASVIQIKQQGRSHLNNIAENEQLESQRPFRFMLH